MVASKPFLQAGKRQQPRDGVRLQRGPGYQRDPNDAGQDLDVGVLRTA